MTKDIKRLLEDAYKPAKIDKGIEEEKLEDGTASDLGAIPTGHVVKTKKEEN